MVMVVDMCHFMKAHKARSWNNLNLIWFWFSQSECTRFGDGRIPIGVCRKQQCIKRWYYNSSWGFKYNTWYHPGGACKQCAGTWNRISAYSFWLTQQTLLHTIRGGRSIKSIGVLVVIIDHNATIMYWSWI